jgi:glycosyltransferase involved in cell wall biosynthesis
LIDARLIGDAGGGFTTYQTQLAAALLKINSQLPWRPVFLVRESGILKLKRLGLLELEYLETDLDFLSPREFLLIPQLLKKARASLWVSTTFSSLISFLMPCPWLIAIHDLNHLKWGGITQKIYYRNILRPFARRARRVLTVSDFSRRELAGWLKLPREAIALARNAVDLAGAAQFSENEMLGGLRKSGLEKERYFFLLTNPKPHKNAELLLRSWRQWADWEEERGNKPIPLVVSFSAPLDGVVKGVKYLGSLRSREVTILMKSAHTLVFPSLYEGFGLPPVEAIASGTPVCVSAIPPHREGLEGVDPACIRWVTEPASQAAWVAALDELARKPLKRPDLMESKKLLSRYTQEQLGEAWSREISLALVPQHSLR